MQANETDFGPHVKDIAEALENKLDEATIVEELRQYVENYGIDLATAKEAIVRKHYGDPRTLQASAFMPLANIKADESSVSFRAKIVSVFSKEINLKDGSQKTIFEGEIADGSATLRFTVWRDEFTAEPGTILEVTNAYSKGWKDRVDLNLGDRCRVREVEDETLAALDVPSAGSPTAGSASDVAGLRNGMGSVTLTVRILDVQEREVTVRGEPKALWSGTLADASGSCRFTAWHDHKLQADTIYEIGNAYVREWQGIPELQINENTAVGTVDAELPSLEELAVGTSYTIDLLDERGGASDALPAPLSGALPPACRRCPRRGLLAGATVTGVLMALFMANAGGAWDNAKKAIEQGRIPGEAKGSDAHAAAIIGDTIGDPFKDTSGPSLNILIKLMSVVSLVIAPLIV